MSRSHSPGSPEPEQQAPQGNPPLQGGPKGTSPDDIIQYLEEKERKSKTGSFSFFSSPTSFQSQLMLLQRSPVATDTISRRQLPLNFYATGSSSLQDLTAPAQPAQHLHQHFPAPQLFSPDHGWQTHSPSQGAYGSFANFAPPTWLTSASTSEQPQDFVPNSAPFFKADLQNHRADFWAQQQQQGSCCPRFLASHRIGDLVGGGHGA